VTEDAIAISVSPPKSILKGYSADSHSCAVLRDGSVKCWGDNGSSQIGVDAKSTFIAMLRGMPDEYVSYSLSPVTVSGITDAVAVGTSGDASCAVLASGKVRCWGGEPQREINGIENAISIVGGPGYGTGHMCALLRTGEVRCWGNNTSGELGNGTIANFDTPKTDIPVTVQGINNAVALAAGGINGTTCAVLQTGEVKCWGQSLLDSDFNAINKIPTAINGIHNAIGIAIGSRHICVLLKNKTIQCLGINKDGVLGNMGLYDSNNRITTELVTVIGVNNPIAIAAGYAHTCALLTTGNVQCWGLNEINQRGNSNIPKYPSSATPVTVKDIFNVKGIYAGFDIYQYAVLKTGEIKKWGGSYSSEYLGEDNINTPITLNGIKDADSLALYENHDIDSNFDYNFSCATLRSGGFQCWGYNQNIDTVLSTPPGKLFSQTPPSLCTVNGGKVQCQGDNTYGQLGNGKIDGIASELPVTVVGINDAVAVTSTYALRNCALLSSGSIQCWGNDVGGALGAGALGYLAPNFVMGVGGQGYLNLSSPLSQNIDKVLSWAESHFPQFNPSGGISVSDSGYRYRGYQNRYYLGANENGIPHIYYFDAVSMTSFMDVGLLSDFLNLIGN
jgi:alpha-tubulin suppressor-like RCC1 family protein